MSLAWLWLLFAGLLEVVWALSLKYSEGFTRFGPSVLTLAALAGSMALLSAAVRTLPLGTAYGVWVGIGALGTAVFGVVLFGEPVSVARVFFLALLLVAIVGLRLTSQ